MLRVAAYTGGCAVPSARFRVRQYIPTLAKDGVNVTEFAERCGRYPPLAIWKRPFWAAANLVEGLSRAPRSHGYDLVLFQRELLSTFHTTERFYGRPRVLDVDDAIWLHRRGSFALRLARNCDAVICGNTCLASYFEASGRPVFHVPTAVDTTRFRPHSKRNDHQGQIIGWSGTSGNLRLLEALDCELAAVLERFQGAHLRVICDRAPNFNRVPASRVEFIHWSPETEVDALRDLSVGLMPLTDTEWSRGKCAFKMLTYMACGVPAVVSPIGMNAELLAEAEVGFGATTTDDWIEAISILLKDGSLAATLGENGRKQVETAYSVNVIAPRLAAIMKEIAGC